MAESDDHLPAEAERYVMPSHYVESDSLEVQEFATSALRDLSLDATKRDKAIRLFEAVRDDIRYDPYCFALDEDSTVPAGSQGQKRHFAFPRRSCLRPVCVLWVSPPHLGSPMCATT